MRTLPSQYSSHWFPCQQPQLIIDPADGTVRKDGCTLVIGAGLARATAAAELTRYFYSGRDYNNGYERLSFRGVEFGGRPASFALTFHLGQLIQVRFGAMSPTAKLNRGWPTRENIDAEVAFMRLLNRLQVSRTSVCLLVHFQGCRPIARRARAAR